MELNSQDIEDKQITSMYNAYKEAKKRLATQEYPDKGDEDIVELYQALRYAARINAKNYHNIDIALTRKALLGGGGKL